MDFHSLGMIEGEEKPYMEWMEKHFPKLAVSGGNISDSAHEVNLFIENNSFERVTLDTEGPLTLKEVKLRNGMVLIPDDKNYHKLVRAAALLKAVMAEIE